MDLNPDDMTPVVNRLKRAQGQLAAVTRMIEEGKDCKAVVTQLSAVSKALDRAGFAIIATGMEKCLCDEGGAMDREDLEKLFLTPAGARLPRGVDRLVCAGETARLVAPLPGAAPRFGGGQADCRGAQEGCRSGDGVRRSHDCGCATV